MIFNTLYLPELRELLAENDTVGLREFCTALHPARTAEFMEGLVADEAWRVLSHAEVSDRLAIFSFFDVTRQVEMIETLDRTEMAELIGQLPPDDRVDILKETDPVTVTELLPLVPADERRDILRLRSYPEQTAGAIMTTEFARVLEGWSVGRALEEIARQAEEWETINYIYVIDDDEHLEGVLSARDLLSAIGRPEQGIGDLMERHVVAVHVEEDQEEVADKVAKFNLSAIPVVDQEHRMLGIITHDDVMDVLREEALEDAQRIGAVAPLSESYLEASLYDLAWKRGVWLILLFFGAMLTALALDGYQESLLQTGWLIMFIPLVISSGGNSGSQSATLVISALSAGHVGVGDWSRIVVREFCQGMLLGSLLAVIGYGAALLLGTDNVIHALIVPVTVLLVVMCGTMLGAVLPLLFDHMGQDPAMMSTPFIAGIIDVVGVVVYMTIAGLLLAL